MIFTLFILSLVVTTPSATRLQASSVDQPLEDTKSPDVGKLLILHFHMITELIHILSFKDVVFIINRIATCTEDVDFNSIMVFLSYL